MNNREWAKDLLSDIRNVEKIASKDKRSNPSYWAAGDPWVSMSDFKDATNFVDESIVDYILEHAQPKV